MAARFWVGGTGNWSDTAHWALTTGAAGGQTVPGSTDDTTFDSSSGSGTATIDAASNCKSITMTSTSITLQHNAFTMTVANAGAYGAINLQSTKYTFSAGASWIFAGTSITCTLTSNSNVLPDVTISGVSGTVSISGSISMGNLSVTGGTFNANGNTVACTSLSSTGSSTRAITFSTGAWTINGGGGIAVLNLVSTGLTTTVTQGSTLINFTGTSGTNTITTAGKTLAGITINGPGGTFQLADSLTTNTNDVVTLTAGTLDSNGQAVSIGSFNSSNSNVRGLLMGSSSWTLKSAGTPNNSFWNTTTTTNLTFTISTSTITTNGSSNTDMFITTGGLTMPPLTCATGTQNSMTTLGDDYTPTGNAAVTLQAGGLNVNNHTLNTTVVNITNTSGTTNLKCVGGTMPAINMNGVGGTVQFADAFISNSILTLTNGTLTNSALVSVTIPGFSSSNSNTRTLSMGNGTTWTLNGSGGVVLWDTSTSTGMTLTQGTSTVTTTGTSGINTFNLGSKILNNMTVNNTAGVTTKLTGSFALTAGTGVFTLTQGTFDGNNNTVSVGRMSSSNSNTRSLLLGGAAWSLSTTGSVVAWDTTTTTGLTFTIGGSTLSYTGGSGNNTLTTGGLSMPDFVQAGVGTITLNDTYNGSLVTLNSGTFAVNNKTFNVTLLNCSAASGTTATLTTGGATVPTMTITATGTGGLTLGDNYTSNSSITLTSGTFTITTRTVNCTNFISSNTNTRTFTMSTGTLSCTGSGNIWDTTTITGMTLTASSGHLVSTYTAGTQTIISGGITMPPIEVNAPGGTLQLSDNVTISTEDIYVQAGTMDLNGKTVTIRKIGMTNTSGTGFLKSSGSTVPAITVNGALGTLQLADTVNCAGALTVSVGTFDAGNQNVTTQTFVSNSGSGRAINMGTGIWSITGTGTVWDTTTPTSLTIVRTPNTIVDLTAVSASSITIATGGATLPTFRAIQAASSGSITVTGAGTFYSFIVKTTTAKTLTMPASTIITIDGAQFFVSGINGALLTYNSSSAATASTIKCGASVAITAGYLSMRDSTTSGAARFVAENSTNTSGNTGWTFNSIDPVKDVRRAASIGRGLM